MTKRKWNKEDIIAKYKQLIVEFGYPPMPKDLREKGLTNLYSQIHKKFGNFESFFEKLGLEYKGRIYWNKKRVINEFKKLERRLGRIPTADDIRKLGDKGDLCSAIYNHFGSYMGFLKECGYAPPKQPVGYWTESNVFKEYCKIAKELGYYPSYSELRVRGYNDITVAMHRIFKGATNFYEKFEIKPKKREIKTWDKNSVLEEYKKIGRELGYAPSEKDLREMERCDLTTAIRRYYKSYSKLQRLGLLESKRYLPRKWTKENIVKEYKEIIVELGFPPSSNQLADLGRLDLAAAITTRYGGFPNLYRDLGVPLKRKDGFWNEETVKKEYINETEKKGSPPTMNELKAMRSDLFNAIKRYYGGIQKLAEDLNIRVSKSYYDEFWAPWEKFVIKICRKIYGGRAHPRLKNNGIPDFITSDNVIIDAKLSYYELLKDDIIKYSPYAKRIEFWINSNYVPKSSEKVIFRGINEIENILYANSLEEDINELNLLSKRIEPEKQTKLSVF